MRVSLSFELKILCLQVSFSVGQQKVQVDYFAPSLCNEDVNSIFIFFGFKKCLSTSHM